MLVLRIQIMERDAYLELVEEGSQEAVECDGALRLPLNGTLLIDQLDEEGTEGSVVQLQNHRNDRINQCVLLFHGD